MVFVLMLSGPGPPGPVKIRRPGKILKLVLHGGRLAYDGFAQLARTRVSFFNIIKGALGRDVERAVLSKTLVLLLPGRCQHPATAPQPNWYSKVRLACVQR